MDLKNIYLIKLYVCARDTGLIFVHFLSSFFNFFVSFQSSCSIREWGRGNSNGMVRGVIVVVNFQVKTTTLIVVRFNNNKREGRNPF